MLAGLVVTDGEGLDTAVLGSCDSRIVLDSACGPAVVASGQNFTAANKPPTRSAAATASGMMTRAGRAFARLASTTFPPKDSPVPLTYSKIRGRANCQLPYETVSSGTEVGMAQLLGQPSAHHSQREPSARWLSKVSVLCETVP